MKKFLTSTIMAGLAVMTFGGPAHAQISFSPIRPGDTQVQKPLFGGPPAHSNLPFDIKTPHSQPAIFSLTLDKYGLFDMGFHAKIHKPLKPKTDDDSDSSSSSDDDGEGLPDVNLYAHSIMNKNLWGGALNGDAESLMYFRKNSIISLNTGRKYGPSLNQESVSMIVSGEDPSQVGSLLVQGPDNCRFILKADEPVPNDGSLEYHWRLRDEKRGCNTVTFPTEVTIDISKSNSIVQPQSQDGIE